MNIVPRTGGNTIKGNRYLAGVTGGMLGSNYTPELKERGLRTPGDLLKLWDYSGSVGGPISIRSACRDARDTRLRTPRNNGPPAG